jgi:hypothetical protein
VSDHEVFGSPAEIRHRIGRDGTFGLRNISGDVRLSANDGEEIVVVARWEHGGDDRPMPVTVRRGEGSLHVETDEKSGWFSFRGHTGITFDVSAPLAARLDISVVSSDVEAHGFTGEQAYKTVSGDLTIEGGGGRVSASTVSGDVNISGDHALEANVNTTSGDVQAFAATFEPVRLRTVSGDMTLRGGFAVGPQHTVESVSGDLDIEATSGLTVDTKRGLDFSKGSKRPMMSGDGSAHLRFRSLSGDVHLSGAPDSPQPQPRPQMDSEDSLEILRALERGEIDVEEASRRLEGAGSRG